MMSATGLARAGRTSASSVIGVLNVRDPSLIWVHTGRGRVVVAGTVHSLAAGQGVWIPAGLEYDVFTDPDSVVFPIFPAFDTVFASFAHPVRTLFPPQWNDWLIHQFARSIGYLRGAAAGGGAGVVRDSSSLGSRAAAPFVALPLQPRSPAAAAIAARLLRAPGDSSTVEELARDANVSSRTLQNQFADETGTTFGRWRIQVRLAAAAALIREGREVGWAAQQVGYATGAGLSKAFSTYIGVSPRGFARHDRTGVEETESARAASSSWPGLSDASHPPAVPAGETWERINDFDVVVWAYRGVAHVQIGRRRIRLAEGDLALLPAGVLNSVALPEGAILLPLGSQEKRLRFAATEVVLGRAPRESDHLLLHTMVSNYSRLRPDIHDPSAIARWLLALRNEDPAPPAEGIIGSLLQQLGDDPADSRNLEEWAEELHVDRELLSQGLSATTGLTLSRWRGKMRMTLARRYLQEGLAVSQVARRLGYSQPASFSEVFTAQHGLSPRAYQRGGWQQTREGLIVP